MRPGTVLVVGAGLAGARAAETLRAEGYDGRLIVVGDEASRPVRAAGPLEGVSRRHQERAAAPAPPAGVLGRLRDRAAARAPRRPHRSGPPNGDPHARARCSPGTPWCSRPAPGRAACRSRRPEGVHTLRTLADARALRASLVAGRPPRRRRRRLHRRRGRLDRSLTRPRRDPDRGAPRAVRADARRGRRSATRGALPLLRRRPSPRHGRRRIRRRRRRRRSRRPAHRRDRGALRPRARRDRRSSRPASSCPIPSPATRSTPAATSPAAAATGRAPPPKGRPSPAGSSASRPSRPSPRSSGRTSSACGSSSSERPHRPAPSPSTAHADSYVARYYDGEGRLVGALAANRPAAVAALRRELEQPLDRGALAA